jgi:predicted RNA-binding protein with EMAP domain
MNTAEDIRILFLEKVIANLLKQVNTAFFASAKRGLHLAEPLREMNNIVMAMKYSYADDGHIAGMEEHGRLRELADEVVDTLAGLCPDERDKQALLRFYRHTFRQFQGAFTLPAELASVVAVRVGEVSTVSKHPKARKLVLCRVNAFGERLEIVTNLVKTRAGQRMQVAMVVPDEVMGVLSEAQFVGDAAADAEVGSRPDLGEHERLEIRKTMGAYLDG